MLNVIKHLETSKLAASNFTAAEVWIGAVSYIWSWCRLHKKYKNILEKIYEKLIKINKTNKINEIKLHIYIHI